MAPIVDRMAAIEQHVANHIAAPTPPPPPPDQPQKIPTVPISERPPETAPTAIPPAVSDIATDQEAWLRMVERFELFKMKKNETITEMFTRFTDITNFLIGLGKEYTQVEMVRKILRAQTPKWEKKITTIEEANDLSTLTVENLIGNLMAYEVQIEDRKKDDEPKKKKILALIASSDTDESDKDDEDITMITKKSK
ncbi:uncharacterized protein LOC109835174 [Asparagus officinalis]|uniref:uncharacterized protein LOC109835174 n=1 Tax=Asparagus officinalis TaxID=4686 RepID=UPI00098E0B0E|nr:uncharacterized protein LOC109835174 [Asparagus officinalis]